MKLILSVTHKVEPWNRKPYQATLTMQDEDTGVSQFCWSGRFKTLERAEYVKANLEEGMRTL